MSLPRHKPRKRFGQHWLRDEDVLTKIIEAAQLTSHDRVLEVGPGQGALTKKLLESSVELVHAIELDRDLVLSLRRKFINHSSRFSLTQGDVLSSPLQPGKGISLNKVVANIPYNITGPLLIRLIGKLGFRKEITYDRLVLLVQKEVGDRILAQPGMSDFSAMSVRISLMANCRSICEVPPQSFYPEPKVNSKVLAFEPLPQEKRLDLKLEKHVDQLLRIAFLGRRKKLKNTLGKINLFSSDENLTKSIGVSLEQRPQELSKEKWVSLAKCFQANKEFSQSIL